jgi:DNA-binding MarR family transcriptional regulator
MGVYALIVKDLAGDADADRHRDRAVPTVQLPRIAPGGAPCHAVLLDLCLAPTGLRTTQLLDPGKARETRADTINALSRELVMDRTTLGRTMLPLERDGLISIRDGTVDRRSRELGLTKKGTERLQVPRNYGSLPRRRSKNNSVSPARQDCGRFCGDVVDCNLDKPVAANG